MDGEQVIEQVQESATIEGASVVAAGVVAQVENVEDTLVEHAEVSEERHVEILEGQEWLKETLSRLQSDLTTLQAGLNSLTLAVTTQGTAILTYLESTQSTPRQSTPEAIVEVIPVVEPPPAVVEDPPVPETPPKPKYRKML